MSILTPRTKEAIKTQLSSFLGLGLMIFAATFGICYLYAAPRQALGRTMGLVMLVVIIGVSNERSYNFLNVPNTVLQFAAMFALLALTANIPHLARPEKAFLRQIGRFFRSCDYLMTTMRWDQDGELFYRLLGAYRGLSEAAIEYAGTAGGIDWSRWRESRF